MGLSANEIANQTEELSDPLPVIDDAIVAVQVQGLEYLWVDAVCIDQVNDSYKISQVNTMDRIYGGDSPQHALSRLYLIPSAQLSLTLCQLRYSSLYLRVFRS